MLAATVSKYISLHLVLRSVQREKVAKVAENFLAMCSKV